jgi:hypothetical protein
VLFDRSGVNPADLRTVKLSPARPIWLFRKTCVIRISDRLVSACRRPHTPRAALRLGAARGPASYTELPKTLRTIPTYSVYGTIARPLRPSPESGLFLGDWQEINYLDHARGDTNPTRQRGDRRRHALASASVPRWRVGLVWPVFSVPVSMRSLETDRSLGDFRAAGRLDGRSAMATGWLPSLSDGVRGPSHPPGGCSLTRPPSCCVARPRAWSRTSILNRFASLLAGG